MRVTRRHPLMAPPSPPVTWRTSSVSSPSTVVHAAYSHALKISSWMDSRKDIKLSPLDHAARLDMIAKVHATSKAEEYYNKLPNYASREVASFPLLHCYVADRIPATNYMTAILCFPKLGDTDQAEWIFGSCEAECRKHDVLVSNVLLGAYVRNGWIEKAEKLHLHMLEKGARPNYKTWEILLEGFVQSRKMDEAVNAMKKALSLMKSCHWRPPLKLSEAIATFFEEQGNTDDASRYQLLQKFNLTSLPLYKSVLRAYSKTDTILPTNISEMIARDDIVMVEEMDHLIIRASKIDISGEGVTTKCNNL